MCCIIEVFISFFKQIKVLINTTLYVPVNDLDLRRDVVVLNLCFLHVSALFFLILSREFFI